MKEINHQSCQRNIETRSLAIKQSFLSTLKCFTYRHKDPCQCSTVSAVQATTRKRLYRCRRQATPTVRSWRSIDRFHQKHCNSIEKFSSYKKRKEKKRKTVFYTRMRKFDKRVTTSLPELDATDHRPVSLNCTAEQPRPSRDCKLKSNSHDPIRGLENRRSRPFALVDPLAARSKAAARYCCSPWISYWCPPCSLLSCNRQDNFSFTSRRTRNISPRRI